MVLYYCTHKNPLTLKGILSNGLHTQYCSVAEIILTSPKSSHYLSLPYGKKKMSFLSYKKSQFLLPGVSLPFELCWKTNNQMSFGSLESNRRPYLSHPHHLTYIIYTVALGGMRPLPIHFASGRQHLQL